MQRATKTPLGDAIRRVIAARDTFCVFQPLVDLRTQKVFAYESLARTKAPEFEGPMQLFAAAVSEGLTGELGRLSYRVAGAERIDEIGGARRQRSDFDDSLRPNDERVLAFPIEGDLARFAVPNIQAPYREGRQCRSYDVH